MDLTCNRLMATSSQRNVSPPSSRSISKLMLVLVAKYPANVRLMSWTLDAAAPPAKDGLTVYISIPLGAATFSQVG